VRVSTSLVAFVASILLLDLRSAAVQPEETLTGRLATVEPALRRIAIVPDGEFRPAELFVAEDATLASGEQRLSLSDLVLLVGRRVTASIEETDDRQLVRHLTVDPER
jgi:hypothetical protein